MNTKIIRSLFVILVSLYSAVSLAETVNLNNQMHFDILKRNIQIGIELTSDIRQTHYGYGYAKVDITNPNSKILGNDGSPARCILEVRADRFKEFVLKEGTKKYYNVGTLGSLMYGYETMGLMQGHEFSQTKRGKEGDRIAGLKLKNLPYKEDQDGFPAALYLRDYETYPMSTFFFVCDPSYINIFFVKGN